MENIAILHVGECPMAIDVQSLENQFVRSDISEPIRVLACAGSSLLEQIRSQQFDDVQLCKIHDKVLRREAKEVVIDSDGILRIKGRVCVPRVGDLTRLILEEARSLRLTKFVHFIPAQTTYNLEKLARIYIRDIFRLRDQFGSGYAVYFSLFVVYAEGVRPWGNDLLRDSLDKVKLIQDRLLTAQSRQKS
ncbi:hypothetical protein K7X08_022232 [Anisodus acutangulus]|uniref:Uncharacterized protein n=1 Tax=Anisodus acutangulus TaxID=402998 RepID=A0A9Q1QVF2_9SOLA|nr:hypothetical protein K7X08_022232 [Anisodus acutangulus]